MSGQSDKESVELKTVPSFSIETRSSRPSVVNRYLQKVTQLGWKRFHIISMIASIIIPFIIVITWFISLKVIDKTPSDLTVSATIGTLGSVKWINFTVMTICVFILSWIILIRNLQIRILFERNQELTIKMDNDYVEYKDYICPCCCTRNACGGPIIHSRRLHGNCVRNWKYHLTTYRGCNYLTTITNVIAWISTILLTFFDLYTSYTWKLLHIIFTGLAALFLYFYQFTHAILLIKDRHNEYKKSNKCRNVYYFIDGIYCFTLPLVSLLFYFIHLGTASYAAKASGEVVDDIETNYTYEWIGFILLMLYYPIFAWLFYINSVDDELISYSNFQCCYCYF